ncbi:MAG: RagB/SusD family nutrient uptake outer membrane protein [Bacteroidales bacterium]|nr:RagB/SusD family nutrient uptake outer membrane protein [Bacteroidales bacterium]
MKKIVSLLIIVFALSSCVDLEEEVYDRLPADKYPENEIQGALVTGPIYEPLQDFMDWSGWWFCQEATTDELVFPTRHTDWDDGGKWRVLHQHTWTNTTEAINDMWSRFYRGIGEANQLLELLGESEDPAAAATLAKIKIMRAFYYYELIDNYGDVPFVTSFSDAVEQPSTDPKAEIWAAIVQDVEESAPKLGSSSAKTAVTKGMAYTLLAKLYLNGEIYSGVSDNTYWGKAEAACDSVLELGYTLEADPMAPFITENQDSPENIFTIPYDEDTYQGFNIHMRTLHYSSNLTFNMTAGPWNGCAVLEDHYNTFEDEDIRKIEGFLVGPQFTADGQPITDATAEAPLSFNPYIPALSMDLSYTYEEIRMSGARVVKFEVKKGAKADLSNDFPIFRLADVYLMKAEAILRGGGTPAEALEYVTPIRERANASDWSAGDLDLEAILAERGREMFIEGHRRQDLIRFGEFNKAWWEKDASTPDRNTFPIPQWVIDSNPNLAN